MSAELPIIAFASASEWEAWLEENQDSPGVRVKIAKKATGIESVRYPEVLDSAICFGWIDGVRNSLDDEYFLQKFTPRTKRSKWSKVNQKKVEALTAAGRMRPRGIAEVDRAKADGRWEAAYDSQKNMAVPKDLQAELDARPAAKEFFEGLNSQNRYAILFRLHDAKRPETRARRLEKFVGMLERGETLH